jgi:putative ABC transport system substrate-binding protein
MKLQLHSIEVRKPSELDNAFQIARRPRGRATNQVRVHRQSQSRESDRPDDSAQSAGAGGPGDQVGVSCEAEVLSHRREKRMVVNYLWWVLVAFCVASAVGAKAQSPTHIPKIGIVTAQPLAAVAARHEAFRKGLRDLGYNEGKNLVIEHRSAEGKLDRLPALMAEIVRLKVDIIVSYGSTTTRAAKQATSTIPIVMAQDTDPIGNGFVASLARPGGNITGLSSLAADLSGKRLELLKEILPKLSHVAVMGTSSNPGNTQSVKETEIAATAFGVKLQYVDILGPKNIEPAFQAAGKGRADGVFVLRSPVLNSHRKQFAQLAGQSRLPATYPTSEFVDAGGLMFYGVNNTDLDRRAATYVDKILKGRTPAELPVEQPMKFEFIVNLKTAKQIGMTMPPQVLARADRVIR